jgi:PAS domain S-box-containing protein
MATVETTARPGDGEEFEIEATLTLLTEDGEFRGTIGVVRDITERTERERELERYETIVRTIPDIVTVLDIEGCHEMINNMGRTGYTREDLLGEHFSMTTTEEDVEEAERVVRELLTSDAEKATLEQDLVTKDGEHVPYETHLALLPPDEDGYVPGVVSVLRDISDRKARERELERQNERLEEFASVVSHDLRNPLNVARGHLDLLANECDSGRIGTIQQAHARMESIIEDTLTLARQGQTVGGTELVQLADLAEECWPNVEMRRAELVSEPVAVVADPDRARHLLENLFRNSVEHGGPDVTIRLGPLDDGFYVEDDGPGIPPGQLEEVLDAGYSTNEDGTGLGLTIVRNVAEAHGWSVAVTESESGGGERADGSRDSPDRGSGGARFEFTNLDGES